VVVRAGMERPTIETMRQARRRLHQVRRSQIDAIRRLATTEEQLAVTFAELARGSHAERRAELARHAKAQAARLRSYADRLDHGGQGRAG
jgi:hypothetical protein